MDIGFDAKRLFCNFTGLGNYSRTLLSGLAKHHPENKYHLYTPRIRQNQETGPFLNHPRIKVHLHEGPGKALWRSWSMVKDLKRDKMELFHGLSHEIPFRIHKSGIRSVVSMHDIIFKIYPDTYSLIDREIYDLKFAYALRHADKVLAISQSTKRDILRFYNVNPEKIEVVYQSVNPVFFKQHSQEERDAVRNQYGIPEVFFLYVGSVEKRKNLKTLIQALDLMPGSIRAPLVVAGRGGRYKEECRNEVESKGLDKQVIWLDYLQTNEHLSSLLQSAVALVYPSLYEGFGLPVAEALASKTPVITSRVSSLPEAGGPESVYVDPQSPQELANAMEKVLLDEALRKKMSEQGLEYVKSTFDETRILNQVMDCYRRIF